MSRGFNECALVVLTSTAIVACQGKSDTGHEEIGPDSGWPSPQLTFNEVTIEYNAEDATNGTGRWKYRCMEYGWSNITHVDIRGGSAGIWEERHEMTEWDYGADFYWDEWVITLEVVDSLPEYLPGRTTLFTIGDYGTLTFMFTAFDYFESNYYTCVVFGKDPSVFEAYGCSLFDVAVTGIDAQ